LVLAPLWSGCSLFFPQRPVELPPPDVRVSPSGVQFVDLVPGRGEAPVEQGSVVRVHYTGWREDGVQFDSSHDIGRPLTFTVGKGEVVPGWEEGMLGMRQGGVRRLTIPPQLAYGDQGLADRIPPGSTLVLEVQLLELLESPTSGQ
jgi:peptidylprolyl isomerase